MRKPITVYKSNTIRDRLNEGTREIFFLCADVQNKRILMLTAVTNLSSLSFIGQSSEGNRTIVSGSKQ